MNVQERNFNIKTPSFTKNDFVLHHSATSNDTVIQQQVKIFKLPSFICLCKGDADLPFYVVQAYNQDYNQNKGNDDRDDGGVGAIGF